MSKRNIEAIYPLSPAQQGMLFETLAAPGSGIHLEQMACTLSGALDGAAFERAWQELLARHAVLRTGFVWRDQAQPLQIVLRQVEVPLTGEDWRDLPPADQEERLAAELASDRQRDFKLQKAPLLRLRLLRASDDSYHFIWTHHHILMDGWCRPLLLRELFTVYEALTTGGPLDLEPSLPYKEYIDWLRHQDLAAAETFWRKNLQHVQQPTPLGREAARSDAHGEGFGQLRGSLSPTETEALKGLAQQHRLTLNTLVQGVWALLLSRYSGQENVVFGVTVSGRPAELVGIEATVGLFINTLPLAVKICPEAPLASWLAGLQEHNTEMRRFESAASGQIQQWSQVPGALPLYDSLLVFENYPFDTEALADRSRSSGLSLEPRRSKGPVMGGRTRHPVTWLISCSSRLHVQLIFHQRRMAQASADHMVEHFLSLLRHLAAAPEQPIESLLELVPTDQIPAVQTPPQAGVKRPAGKAAMPPRGSIEEVLVTIWSQVLGVPALGVHDSFFELGGHSQLAMQLISLVRQAFGLDLPLRALFEGPTVAELGAEIAQSKGQQEEYQDALAALPAIVPDLQHRAEPFPLTDVQQAYWIGRSGIFELGNVATHIYLESESEHIDLGRFTEAWRRLIARHDMLRMVISEDATQRILAEVPAYDIKVLDLREADPQTVEAQLLAVRERMSHQVLPTDQWPLFEVCASRLSADQVRFHISLDLLIGDAWSWRILFRELALLYLDPEVALPPLELSFRDYVLAQKALEDSALYERSVAYWRRRLASLPPAPALPLQRTPATVENPRFVRRTRGLAPAPWAQLKERALGRGLTPSGLLLAVFAEVLAVWSKTPRFTINLTLFNRLPRHPQVNQVIGDFTSLMLLAADQGAAQTFEDRARHLQQQLWDDLDHRHVSGVWVQRELSKAQGKPARGFMPVVFTSTLTFDAPAQDADRDKARQAFQLKRVYSITQTPQVWLDNQVAETGGGRLRVNWDAVEDLFPEGFLDDMFEAYCGLLERLAAGEEAWQVRNLELVPARHLAERAQINATAAPVSEALLHTLFAQQAARRPEQPAVIAADRSLTYGELHQLAQRIGHHLHQRGARPNTLVAVVMKKGWQQVPAVLGVLAAGAAYLPIDAELPTQRVHELLALGEVRLALTQAQLLEQLPWPDEVEPLAVDQQDFENPKTEDDLELAPIQSPDDLAYVLFTSGSTGTPKGVMIEHRSAVNTLVDMNQRFAVAPGDRVLALSALSFDLSVFDIFGVLAAGGSIVLPTAQAARDPEHWLDLMERQEVTLWNSVPALLQMLVEYAAGQGRSLPKALRLVLLSGDWIPLDLPRRIRRLGEGVEVVSLGGATEASIWSILYPIGEVETEWKSIPYGKPMLNQSWHVLNERLEPCPLWVPGQLYIGGVGLARGYWRNPAATEASFLHHPQHGERLYRTGDLGRFLPDGNIEFLGREDSQVKVQGWRIELGEIEAALAQHPAVQGAAVTAVGPRHGDKHLAAYVVVDPEAASLKGREQDSGHGAKRRQRAVNHRQRLAHKMSQPGLRPAADGATADGAAPIQLTRPELDQATVEKLYLSRRSHREFASEPIPLADFSQLLSCLAQLRLDHLTAEGSPLPKYRYASAGSLYPIQVYFYVKPERIEGIPAGTYYYHPVEHHLIPLEPDAHIDPQIHAPVNRAIWGGSAFSIFLVAQMRAIQPIYGEASQRYAMLEAGAISQLLETSAPEHHIGLCQIGELDSAALRPLLALEESHLWVHSLLGGRIDPSATTLEAFVDAARETRSLLEMTTPNPGDDFGGGAGTTTSPQSAVPQVVDEEAVRRALRRFLAEKLPDYMIPSTFTLLDSLPLTANGKVDRAALPKVHQTREKPQGPAYVEPKSEIERQIANLWQETLHTERVGLHDNFFDLGGNSVLMVRVYNKLREVLGREFPLVALFEHPTIHFLAAFFSQEQSANPALHRGFDRGARRKKRRRK